MALWKRTAIIFAVLVGAYATLEPWIELQESGTARQLMYVLHPEDTRIVESQMRRMGRLSVLYPEIEAVYKPKLRSLLDQGIPADTADSLATMHVSAVLDSATVGECLRLTRACEDNREAYYEHREPYAQKIERVRKALLHLTLIAPTLAIIVTLAWIRSLRRGTAIEDPIGDEEPSSSLSQP